MSRCYCCNRPLSNKEAVRRFAGSGEYTEMCDTCLKTIDDEVDTVEGANPGEEDDSEEYDA